MPDTSEILLKLLSNIGDVVIVKDTNAVFVSVQENVFIDSKHEYVGTTLTEALTAAVSELLEDKYTLMLDHIPNKTAPAILGSGFIAHKNMYHDYFIAALLTQVLSVPVTEDIIKESNLSVGDRYRLMEWCTYVADEANENDWEKVERPNCYDRIVNNVLGLEMVNGFAINPATSQPMTEDQADDYRFRMFDKFDDMSEELN